MRYFPTLGALLVGALVAGSVAGRDLIAHTAAHSRPGDADVLRPSAGPSRDWTPSCTFSPGPNVCRGVLPSNFDAEALRAIDLAQWPGYGLEAPANRQWSCTPGDDDQCPRTNLAKPIVNPDSRKYSPADLGNAQAILVGVIRWYPQNKQHKDRRYKIGDNSSNSERLSYIVASRGKGTSGAQGTVKKVVAEWTMYAIDGSGTPLRKERTGKIYRCNSSHEPNDLIEARFLGCSGEAALVALAKASGLSTSTIFHLTTCDLLAALGSAQGNVQKDGDGGCSAGSRMRDSSVKALGVLSPRNFTSLIEILADESRAAYWYACANGCCTADQ